MRVPNRHLSTGAELRWDTEERAALAELTAEFTRKEILPHQDEWERTGIVPVSLHRKAAAVGLLGLGVPERVGGSGGSLLDALTFHETMLLTGAPAGVLVALTPHIIALPSVVRHDRPDQVERFVRPVLAGELVCALAVTEPGGGSDVSGMRTVAVRDGDGWVLNGAKTYISSGHRAGVVTVAARTVVDGKSGISLFLVESDRPGFAVGRKLEKMGWLSSDTAELSFTDVRIPAGHLVGPVNGGFAQLMEQFRSERLFLAQHCCALGQRALDLSVEWVRDRSTFGRPLAERQVVRHRIAQMWTRLQVARTHLRHTALRSLSGEDVTAEISAAKNCAVETGEWVANQAVQLFGGLGYMRESEVERIYRDVRLYGIGGGTTEIMNEVIAKQVIG